MTWPRSEEGAMPKMYRVEGGDSYTWEYVDAVRQDGKPDPGDKVLARPARGPYKDKKEIEDEIRDLRNAKVKWPGKDPE
jgi:hypothetical protein